MADTFTLKPGIYNLMPCDVSTHDKRIHVCIDPVRYHAERHDWDNRPRGCHHAAHPSRRRIAPLHRREDILIVRVDIAERLLDGNSMQTPYGPLTRARHYAIVPTDRISRHPSPDTQYARNWIGFDLSGEQPLSVEGSVIRIGGMEIDVAAMGDLEHTEYRLDGKVTCWSDAFRAGRSGEIESIRHVAVTGDPLHAILSTMPCNLDDGVLTTLTFTPEQATEVEWIGTPAADAFALMMREQLAGGRNHIVLRPALS